MNLWDAARADLRTKTDTELTELLRHDTTGLVSAEIGDRDTERHGLTYDEIMAQPNS